MPIKNINPQTLKNWLENNEAVLVDVREPAEHAAENISEANLVPLTTLQKESLPNLANKKLVIHCRSGARSQKACDKLLAQDCNLEIYNLEGGISAWVGAGHEVNSSKKFFLPLDRQVQLVIGLGTLVGGLLTHFVSPLFLILPLFFGAGLTFAALTGYCGLAIFLTKMPWNKGVKAATSCSIK
ncbi:MAG: DUF2892 domain-containing protein [Rickettsiales bacterium]|nr:DUF2892 domain-containing protein [Rickettsiales bacterium]